MPQKVWTAGPDGQFDYLNNMLLEYAGLPADQLTGGVDEPDSSDDLQFQLNAWNHSLSHGEMFEIEHRLRKSSGEYRWHLARALPVYRPRWPDRHVGLRTNTDIDDQKQAEESLREEHHRKDQFLALLAHELRNPLSPLSNAIQVFPSVQKRFRPVPRRCWESCSDRFAR